MKEKIKQILINYFVILGTLLVFAQIRSLIGGDSVSSESFAWLFFIYGTASVPLFVTIYVYSFLEKSLVANWKVLIFATVFAMVETILWEFDLSLVSILRIEFFPNEKSIFNDVVNLLTYCFVIVGLFILVLKLYRKCITMLQQE